MAFLIDGFNLIYKFPQLEELMYQDRLVDARVGLLNKLKEYQKIAHPRIRVIFDGRKDISLEIKREKVGSIDVYYSLDYSADFLIKEFIKNDLNPRMTTVVTSDNDIIQYVSRFRARVKKSEEFVNIVNNAIDRWLESHTIEKDDNPLLTEDELLYWEDVFNNNKNKK